MNRSIPAFFIGLISSIIGAVCALLFWFVFVLIGAIAGGTFEIIIHTIPFVNLACFVISLIGSCLCIKYSKVGGAIMLGSSIISFICFIVLSIAIKTVSIITVLFWIPAILILVASLLALKAHKVN